LSLSWSIDIHKSVGTSFLASKYVFAWKIIPKLETLC
jgi:hypothetical protein